MRNCLLPTKHIFNQQHITTYNFAYSYKEQPQFKLFNFILKKENVKIMFLELDFAKMN